MTEEERKVYMSKLPKDCKTCPLDSTSELVKEVCEEIRKKSEEYLASYICECGKRTTFYFVDIEDFDEILQKVLKKYGVGGENEGK